MEKPADTEHEVHPLIRKRWSPRAFTEQPVTDAQLRSMIEAARWAPSSFNAQPWRFVVARRGSDAHAAVAATLNVFNQQWAARAPLFIVSTARPRLELNGELNRFALHDVGLATSQLVLQATALDLSVHQMAGYSLDALRAALALPPEVVPLAVLAVGYAGEPDSLPEAFKELERAPRSRTPQTELVFDGVWGRVLS